MDTSAAPTATPDLSNVPATAAPAPQPAPIAPTAPAAPSGVRAKLAAYRSAHEGEVTVQLPETGILATYPAFIGHDAIAEVGRMAGKRQRDFGKVLIARLCTFEGDRLTADEIGAGLPNADVVFLLGRLVGKDGAEDGDDTESDLGN